MNERWKPSVTVAAVIEDRDADGVSRFLLVEEHTPEGLQLNNPAGHLEPGESPQQGVLREVLEETGRAFSPHCLVGVYLARFQRPASAEDVTYLRLAFGGAVGPAQPGRTLDAGIVATHWLTIDELRASRSLHRSPLVLQCVEDYLAGQRHSLSLVRSDDSLRVPEIKRAVR